MLIILRIFAHLHVENIKCLFGIRDIASQYVSEKISCSAPVGATENGEMKFMPVVPGVPYSEPLALP